jgi:hypothetical protein
MEAVINTLAQKPVLWWINEVGILLEIIGATVIVVAAFRSRARIKDVPDSWDSDLAVKLRDIISSQATTELKGFGLFAIGLIGQMIGGFQQ